MEVASTPTLLSSETKKTTACNFQIMNSGYVTCLMRGQIGIHANEIFIQFH